MRILHTSDLHLGKRVNDFPMLEDQAYILGSLLCTVVTERPDAFIIAGDVYDKAVPTAEAVALFDHFLVRLSELSVPTFIISGNHDSPERLGFASRLIGKGGIHIHGIYEGRVGKYTLEDEYGKVNIYTLPFVKPSHVRRYFPEAEIESYTDAVRCALSEVALDKSERNILVTHQFVTGASRTDSEELSVGGSDNVDAEVFSDFDYVALGHIHRSQRAGAENIRYSGSILKYSFSEARDEKSLTLVELSDKGRVDITKIPLKPKTEMSELRGEYNELLKKSFYESGDFRDDYLHITLTDEEDIPDAVNKLRVVYKNLMQLDYDNRRTRHRAEIDAAYAVEEKSPLELFAELFELQNNRPLSKSESEYVRALIERIWEGEE